ncbi:MAG: SpoIIE family protein phosphatase [Actinomycetota bacterium]|nr:SpoIIE family protein phosphatase [Actinomycetota bacterium]
MGDGGGVRPDGRRSLEPPDEGGEVVARVVGPRGPVPLEALPDEIRIRALVAAGLSVTISDPHAPDHPLMWVNPAFTEMTGYSAAEAVGRNCRFLQGEGTDPAAVDELRRAIAAGQPAQVQLLNFRRDGTPFWNEVSIAPVRDVAGRLTHYVGVQADVTARVEAQREREALLVAEQNARAHAERIQRRLALLADATEALVSTLDVDDAIERLVDVVVPRLADWCVVDLLVDEHGSSGAHRLAAAHVDRRRREALARLKHLQPRRLTELAPVQRVVATGRPVLEARADPGRFATYGGPELAACYAELGYASAMVVPLQARRQLFGTLTLVRTDAAEPYGEEELALATDLARRASLIVDNARLYAREHLAAEALQRSLLPDLPEVRGLDVAARYLPGAVGAAVGGDWYDVLHLPDGAVGIAIGDVMGHDMAAAAAMGQLRSVLRSYAWARQTPGQVLDSLDRLVQGLDMAQLATAVFARLELDEHGHGGVLHYANAGHLPPLVAYPDGRVRRLEGGWSCLIGAPDAEARQHAREELPAGATLVLCTDGLVESRAVDVETGLSGLEEALHRACRDGASAKAICDALVAELRAEEREDDTAVLVLRLVQDLATGGPAREERLAGRRLVLASQPSSSRRARQLVRSALVGAGEELVEVATLLVSELVSNAVMHGRGEVGLLVRLDQAMLRVEVDDADPRLPARPRPLRHGELPLPEAGRGVLVLDALAHRWGSVPMGEGKRVWFELDRPELALSSPEC